MADNEQTRFASAALSGACPEGCRRDANGNLTTAGGYTYSFDARNHLSAASGTGTGSFVGACPECRRRDGLGRRVKKVVGTSITQFVGACPECCRRDGVNPVQLLNGSTPPALLANQLTGLGVDARPHRQPLSDGLGAQPPCHLRPI